MSSPSFPPSSNEWANQVADKCFVVQAQYEKLNNIADKVALGLKVSAIFFAVLGGALLIGGASGAIIPIGMALALGYLAYNAKKILPNLENIKNSLLDHIDSNSSVPTISSQKIKETLKKDTWHCNWIIDQSVDLVANYVPELMIK